MKLVLKKNKTLIVYSISFIVLYIIIKTVIIPANFFEFIFIAYSKLISSSLNLFTDGFYYNTESGNLIYYNITIPTQKSLALKYYIIVVGILLFKPKLNKSFFLTLILAFIGLYILQIGRYFNDLFTPKEFLGFLFWVVVSLRYLIVYLVLHYKINQHNGSIKVFNSIDQKVQSTFQIRLHTLMIIIAMIPAIAGFFDWFLIAKWNIFVDWLSALILGISEQILFLSGYKDAYIADKTLHLHNYWLNLGTNCLGVGLMVVFSCIIFSIRSPFFNKILYVIIGLIFIIFLNAIRIDAILLHIYTHQTPQHLIEDYHDLSNNVYYLVVFVFVLIYIAWFQNINFRKNQKQ